MNRLLSKEVVKTVTSKTIEDVENDLQDGVDLHSIQTDLKD